MEIKPLFYQVTTCLRT